MNLLQQWKGVSGYMINDPGTFFSQYNEKHGVGYPLQFLLVTSLVSMLIPAVLSILLNVSSPATAALGGLIILGLGLVTWLGAVIEALLVHLVAMAFGKRGVATTLEAYAFPAIVRHGLWWIPIVNLALGLYGWYLQIKALAAFHDLSTGKAVVAAVIGALLYVPALVVVAAVIATFVLELGSSTGAGAGV
ncbi:YIP1 family protein [Natrinema longum]|uniref:YIP1 family protein n=1 Tax=Natrinema longum TaxID=370324 RepID=A0A8A2U7B5_9EURY|nr:YIP1 family protein [Natrinema longum]MBZ6494385.1 YIP1 family protein [Natrinema longum]QSW84292.1 YIP1 family protein [Natrinema longum]